jgi:hypothetical protein
MDNVNQGTDQVSELVGEGKKYKSFAELEKAYLNASSFIDTLKNEKSEVEQRLTNLSVDMEKASKTNPAQNTTQQSSHGSSQGSQLTEDRIQSLIDNRLKEVETTRTRESNLNSAKKYLLDNFGDNFEDALNKQASEMGVTKEKLFEIASETPNVFKRLLPGTKPTTQDPTTPGSRNTEAADLSSPNDGDLTEYQRLSKEAKKNPAKFYRDANNWKKLLAAKQQEMSG